MAVCLRRVDLPPIFGPVTKSNDYPEFGSIRVSLGTKSLVPVNVTQGCTACEMFK